MPLSIMKKLVITLSRKCLGKMILNYEEFKVCGLTEGRTFFHTYPEKEFSINIVIVETNLTWGMILSKQLIKYLNLSISEDSSTIYLPWKENSYVSIPKQEFSAPMISTSQESDNDLEEENNKLGEWRI